MVALGIQAGFTYEEIENAIPYALLLQCAMGAAISSLSQAGSAPPFFKWSARDEGEERSLAQRIKDLRTQAETQDNGSTWSNDQDWAGL